MSIRYLSHEQQLVARPVSHYRKINAKIKKAIRKEERRRNTILKLSMEAQQLVAQLRELTMDAHHIGNYVTERKKND